MKPLRLHLQAFGPYSKEALVDFRDLKNGGLFLIHGQTGAGKTSLLDGLCFSLFGTASGADRSAEGLRSDLASGDLPTEARLEFAIGENLYRVVRRPKQRLKKKRGDGFTEKPVEGTLERLTPAYVIANGGPLGVLEGAALDAPLEAWELLASGAAETDQQIAELLGMTEDQFRQVVVLPQGQFRKFLASSSTDREDLLETLFRTERYRLLGETLDRRSKTIAEKLTKVRTERDALLTSLEATSIENLTENISSADTKLASFETSSSEMESVYQAALNRLNTFRDVQSIGRDLERLKTETAQNETALGLRESELAKIKNIRESLEAKKPEVERLEGEQNELRNHYKRAVELSNETLSRTRLEEAVSKAAALTKDQETKLQALQRRKPELETQIQDLLLEAQRAATLRAERELLNKEQLELKRAATLAVDLAKTEALLEKETVARTTALGHQRDHAVELKSLKLDFHLSQAARLAAELRQGEPCAVCGSLVHPSPAKPGARSPTLEQIEAKELEAAQIAKRVSEHETQIGRLETKRQETENSLRHAFKEWNGSTESLNEAQKALESRLQKLESALRASQLAETQRAQASKELELLGSNIQRAENDLKRQTDAWTAAKGQVQASTAKVEQLEAMIPTEWRDVEKIKTEGQRLKVLVEAHRNELAETLLALEKAASVVSNLKGTLSTLKDQLAQKTAAKESILQALASQNLTEADFEKIEADFKALDAERASHRAEHLSLKERIRSWKAALTKLQKFEIEFIELTNQHAVVGKLAETAAGRAPNLSRVNFQRFILASRLDEVLEQASRRLFVMSRGQFTLRRARQLEDKRKSAGLDLEVEDSLSGTTRPTASLSGGEGFLASLSLALGLADVVQNHLGGVRLDAVFVDEGFGTLDPEALEQAMRILTDLQAGGRIVGIISHVPELRDQISRRLSIRETQEGSTISWD